MIPYNRYLIDANVFIQAKNFHYRFDFCQAFWQWLTDGHAAGLIFSSAKVLQELNGGNDDDLVKQWASQLPDSFFIPDTHDNQVMRAYGRVMEWNSTNNHYLKQAKDEFARFDNADAFLIAAAMAHKFILVTHEARNPARKNKILIPDAANALGIDDSIMIYDLLSLHATGSFSFKS